MDSLIHVTITNNLSDMTFDDNFYLDPHIEHFKSMLESQHLSQKCQSL